MIAYCNLTELAFSFFALCSFLLICVGIVSVVLSLSIKRYRYCVLSLVLAALPYSLWQITIALSHPEEIQTPVCIRMGELPYLFWLFLLLMHSAASAALLLSCIRFSRTNITPLEISRCADKMPCGICYWRENGRVVYSNKRMNDICIALTGRPLMNGNHFSHAVPKDTLSIKDRVWNSTCRDVELGGELLHGMIAWDVSEIHEKTETLRKENEKLTDFNEALRSYSLKIDEIVRRQEILQAKINIHDEMNKLMLTTLTADLFDKEKSDQLFSLWKENALFLSMEAEEKSGDKAFRQLDGLAEALGLRLIWKSRLPETLDTKQLELFFSTAQEAITNAVKHAGAESLTISFTEDHERICCIFENDGNIPDTDIRFTGGLANLSVLAGGQSTAVTAESGETFRLTLRFMKGKH